MATLGARINRLYVDFRYWDIRHREYNGVIDTPANRTQAPQLIKKKEAELLSAHSIISPISQKEKQPTYFTHSRSGKKTRGPPHTYLSILQRFGSQKNKLSDDNRIKTSIASTSTGILIPTSKGKRSTKLIKSCFYNFVYPSQNSMINRTTHS